jgi:hypothetical protein
VSQVGGVRVGQCVYAVGAVEVPVILRTPSLPNDFGNQKTKGMPPVHSLPHVAASSESASDTW